MAANKVNIDLTLQDSSASIKKRTKEVEELNKQLTKSQQMATGTKTGASAVKSTYNAASENLAYGQARGSMGATGASARDFANQSQGLGGLVRLYATYAANLFAVSAAFSALRNAADTTSMIQGMNQLGAVSGLALGTIAKDLVKATDGAISMREAIEATTKGTAAGLSAKQMEQLGQVANKASKALGINMPDAISRLTRGISKLEPELLDELGLFTKIGPATEDYARSIGKSVSALTDFERRQSFANAVLKEGIDKFGSIDIAANPYDKLLATLKDLSFKALELVNTVFVPLISLLSQNPTALLGVLSAIGLSILKTAIPALGQYRENLKRTADESRAAFSKMYTNQQEAYSNLAQDQAVAAERAFRNSKDTQTKLQGLAQEGSKVRKTKAVDYTSLASKNAFGLTPVEIKALDDRANMLAKTNAKEADMLRKHIANIKAIRAESSNIGDMAAASAISGSEKITSTALANDIINRRQLQTISAQTIRSNAAETQATLGMRAAYKQLNEDLDKAKKGFLQVQTGIDENGKAIMQAAPKLGMLQAGYTRVASSVGIVVQKLATTVQAFGRIGMAIGTAIATFYMLDSWLTKTERQSEAFNKAISGTADAVDNTNRTLEALAKQPGIASATIQGILALSNASNTTTSAIEEQLDATKALLQALNSSIWDRYKNNIAGFFGKGIAAESAKNLADTVQTQLKLFRAAGLGDEATQNFKSAIGVESLDVDTVTTAFKEGTAAQDAFAQSNKQLNVKLLESSTNLQSFKSATDAVTKAYDEFIQSTASTNPLFKIGAALEDASVAMQKIANSDIRDINAAFNDLADNPKKIAQFGQSFVDQFIAIRQGFKTSLQDYEAYNQSIANIQEQIDQNTERKKNVKKTRDSITPVYPGSRRVGEDPLTAEQQRAQYDTANATLESKKKILEDLKVGIDSKVFKQAQELFGKGITDSFKAGSKIIEDALGQASKQAALTVERAGLGALTGQRAAEASGKIKQEEIKLQIEQVNSTINLITTTTLLNATMAESNALMAEALAKPDDPDYVKSERSAAVMGARIFKNAVSNVAAGKMPASELDSIRQGAPSQVLKYIDTQLGPYKRSIAQQRATQTVLKGQSDAASIETARATKLGKTEDLSKKRNLENEINQQLLSRVDILSSVDELNSAQQIKERTRLENLILENKQQQENAGYKTAIDNAEALGAQGAKEVKQQQDLLELAKKRQKAETDTKGFADKVKLQAAELMDATKLNALKDAGLDQYIGILNTMNSIAGISSEQNVIEIASLENIKLEAKFTEETKKAQSNLNTLLKESGNEETESVKRARQGLALVEGRQKFEKDNKGLQDSLKLVEARVAAATKLNGLNEAIIDQEIAIKNTINSIVGISSEQSVRDITRLENIKLENKFAIERLRTEQAINILEKNSDPSLIEESPELKVLRNELALIDKRQKFEKDNKGLQDSLKLVEARLAVTAKLNGLNEAIIDQEIAIKNTISSIVGITSEQSVSDVARLENIKLENKFTQEKLRLQGLINILEKDSDPSLIEESPGVVALRKELDLTDKRQKLETNNKGLQDALKLVDARAAVTAKLTGLNEAIIDQEIATLNVISSIVGITSEQNASDVARLENIKLENKFTQEKLRLQGLINILEKDSDPSIAEESPGVVALRKELDLTDKRQKLERNNKAVTDALKLVDARAAATAKLTALNETIIDQEIAIKNTLSSIVGITSELNVKEIARLENIKLENKFAQETQKLLDTITTLSALKTDEAEKSVARARDELSVVQQRQALEKDNKGLQDSLKLLESRVAIERELAGFRRAAADAQSQQAEDELNFKKQNRLVTDDQAIREKANLDRARLGREYQSDRNSLLEKQNRLNLIGDQLTQFGDFGGPAYDALFESYTTLNKVISENRAAIEANNAQKLNAISLTESLSSRQIAYTNIFENSFASMADAMVNWAETGKWNGKQLFNSLIADLARYELKLQTTDLYKAGIRPGLMNLLSIAPSGDAIGGGMASMAEQKAIYSSMGIASAKGNAFDYGIQAYAKGGTFTNSVVSSPTMFKFAQGTGLMGEAGPEAIMPLKRDASGNLGVRGGGASNTEIVVNNYGKEQATATQTMDARGNRKIEITVGDLAAGEINRTGSNSQKSLKGTFGLQPQLIRR